MEQCDIQLGPRRPKYPNNTLFSMNISASHNIVESFQYGHSGIVVGPVDLHFHSCCVWRLVRPLHVKLGRVRIALTLFPNFLCPHLPCLPCLCRSVALLPYDLILVMLEWRGKFVPRHGHMSPEFTVMMVISLRSSCISLCCQNWRKFFNTVWWRFYCIVNNIIRLITVILQSFALYQNYEIIFIKFLYRN